MTSTGIAVSKSKTGSLRTKGDVIHTRLPRHPRSPTVRRFCPGLPDVPEAITQGEGADNGVDLLDGFRQTLRLGLTHDRVRRQQPTCVILTGGSSAWPFVADIIKEELAHLAQSPRLIQSDRPYVTVSQGLAILPALQTRLTASQTGLRTELPVFIDERIQPLLERRLTDVHGEVVRPVLA